MQTVLNTPMRANRMEVVHGTAEPTANVIADVAFGLALTHPGIDHHAEGGQSRPLHGGAQFWWYCHRVTGAMFLAAMTGLDRLDHVMRDARKVAVQRGREVVLDIVGQ